jgi:hypothetical protein
VDPASHRISDGSATGANAISFAPVWVTLKALRNNLHLNRLESCTDASKQAAYYGFDEERLHQRMMSIGFNL